LKPKTQETRKFEKEYEEWIRSAARDVASGLRKLEPARIKNIMGFYEKCSRNPSSMYEEIQSERERVQGLVDLKGVILLTTEAVIFSPSIFTQRESYFDYAIAMNRRYYLDSWFTIITINKAYLRLASDTMLKYTLLHELYQKEMYEIRLKEGLRLFKPEEKRLINLEAKRKSIDVSGITEEELLREIELMLSLTTTFPLVPKPFAETCLFRYLEENLDKLKGLGNKSSLDSDEKIGKTLYSDFIDWIDFSLEAYRLFLGELKRELDFTYLEYGYG